WRKLADHVASPRGALRNGDTFAFSRKTPRSRTFAGPRFSHSGWTHTVSEGGHRTTVQLWRALWMPDGKTSAGTNRMCQNGGIDKTGGRCERWQDAVQERWVRTRLPIPATDVVEDVSPDGNWFVTISDRDPPHGQAYQLYLIRTDGSEQRRLTKDGMNVCAQF